jgi:hypothetical protein
MIDPMTMRLAQTQYHERLQAAELARRQRATADRTTSLLDLLRAALGKQLIAAGAQIRPYAAPHRTNA